MSASASSDLPGWLIPSEAARKLAERAANLPTALWFNSPQDLDNVIACGRMTMCFNILTHLERQYPVRNVAQQALYEQARADWAQLQANPYVDLSAGGSTTQVSAPSGVPA
jgi:hypothetical protein